MVSELLDSLDEEDRKRYLSLKGSELVCGACEGTRIARRWGAVRVGGRTIGEMTRLSVEELGIELKGLEVTERSRPIVEPILELGRASCRERV